MMNGQLELCLKAERTNLPRSLRRRPQSAAAQWWFERMREVVDRAMDYDSSPSRTTTRLSGLEPAAVLAHS